MDVLLFDWMLHLVRFGGSLDHWSIVYGLEMLELHFRSFYRAAIHRATLQTDANGLYLIYGSPP